MPPIRRGDAPDQYGPRGVSNVGRDDLGDLQAFVVQLGAGLSAAGEPVDVVQQQLARVASAYGAEGARISAFPTFMMVSMGRGEPAALEITTSFGTAPGLDQIAALDRLVREAERGEVPPTEGLAAPRRDRQHDGALRGDADHPRVLGVHGRPVPHPAARPP